MTVSPDVAAAARDAADALAEQQAEAISDESPVQCYVVGDIDPQARTFTGLIEGETRADIPFAAPYYPNPGDVCWLRGPSGAKVATDRINGGVDEHVIDAATARFSGDAQADGNLAAGGDIGAEGDVYCRDLYATDVHAVGNIGANNADVYCRGLHTTDIAAIGNIQANGDVGCAHLYTDDLTVTGGGSFAGDLQLNGHNLGAGIVYCDDLSCGGLTTNGGPAITGTVQAGSVNCSGVSCSGGISAALDVGARSMYAPPPGGFFGNTQGIHYGECRGAHYGDQHGNCGDGINYQTPASDANLKQDIEPRGPGALAGIDELPVSTFDWRPWTPVAHRGRQTGFIAQQLPDRFVADQDGTLGLEHIGILAEAVAAIQELKSEVRDLRARLNSIAPGSATSSDGEDA